MQFNRRQLIKNTAIAAVTIPAASALTIGTTGCSTAWIDTAIKDIPTAESIAQGVLQIVALASGNGTLDAAIGGLITTAGNLVTAGLTTLESLINDYKATPSGSTLDKIDAALTDLQTNLGSILTISGIKDANLQIAISSAIGLAIAVVSSIQTLVPAAPTSSAVRRAAAVSLVKPTIVPTAAQISSLYNSIVVLHGFAQFQVK
jgi:hypothetical protein